MNENFTKNQDEEKTKNNLINKEIINDNLEEWIMNEKQFGKIHQKIIYLDFSSIPISHNNVVYCFYTLYNAYSQQNIELTIQTLEALRFCAQSSILCEFPEFHQYNFPIIFEELLLSQVRDVQIGVIRFIAELSRSNEQKLFELIIKCSFHNNSLVAASKYINDEYFILDLFKCYYENVKNFPSTRNLIIKLEFLEFYRKIILNNSFKIETRRFPLKIFRVISKADDFSLIQLNIILNFIVPLFKIQQASDLWINFLTLAKKIITNQETCQAVLNNFSTICLNFIMNNKNVAIVANSILLLGRHFMYFDTPIDIDLNKLVKLSKSSKDTVSYAALWMISNMIVSHPIYYALFIEKGIMQIVVNKIESDCAMKTKFEAVSVMANLVNKGNEAARIQCIQSGFIHCFLDILSVDIKKFINTAMNPLYILLELASSNTDWYSAWQEFEEYDGFTIINELTENSDELISSKAIVFYNSLCFLRRNIEI
ncbi:hypothetical protein TRFO_04867 [Tritrichomonas foetus]|uniref:Uncharacterized protein n=1 Tax=Tritrichomonas foetus TaxID=1144522 RepID=A0A1J4KF95_9EUKA|nr:hypothetical protein TRFO_04867 [Tritrichomonas foetus]|eukprot:OHT08270.1 hypothetical protein TRFO_04867 [Tritrichomonas foetus]